MLLEKNSKFSIEYKDFSQRVQQITDEKIKTETSNLLNQLVSCVRHIDDQHRNLAFQQTLSENASTLRFDIARIRKKLGQILDSYEKVARSPSPTINSK